MRGIKARLPLVFLLAAAAAGLAAEEGAAASPEAGARPSVSRLRAGVEGQSVILSWVDSQGPRTSYVVYRSRQSFSQEVLPKAQRLASVEAGIGGYRDNPPPNQDWYYLVLALDADGLPALVFTPMSTMTKLPVRIETQASAAPAMPPTLKTKPLAKAEAQASEKKARDETAGGIPPAADGTERRAQAQDGEKIAESLSGASLEAATEAASGPSTAAASPAPSPVSTDERPAPLPYFLYNSGIPTSSVLGDRPHGAVDEIAPAAEKAAARLRAGAGGSAPAQPAVRELAAADERLAAIVEGMESARDHGEMAAALRKYLETEASPEKTACARYYLGVCLVKDSVLDSGIYELLKARDFFPVETRAWIDYATSLLGEGAR